MILNVLKQIHDRVASAVTAQYGLAGVPPFAIEGTAQSRDGRSRGHGRIPARQTLRKAPRAIRAGTDRRHRPVPGVSKIEAAPNGYLNISLDRRAFLLARLRGEVPAAESDAREKTVVEHTAINPNKAAHIGHLRNATLGDTLVRVLSSAARRSKCRTTSTISASRSRTSSSASANRAQDPERHSGTIADTTRFDYYCWDLYRASPSGTASRPRPAARARALHDLEPAATRRPRSAPSSPIASSAPSEDDGAAEHRLRPADARGRHPPAEVLGARVRDPESAGRRVPADRRQAGRLLGHAHR
jgi:arginyl-tRNA synthetase